MSKKYRNDEIYMHVIFMLLHKFTFELLPSICWYFFSFLEVLVSIVISGIVISTAYSVYVFTHKQFFKFTSAKTEIRDYFELSNVLNREFETAKKVIKTGEQEIEIRWRQLEGVSLLSKTPEVKINELG